jgi:hypothetical protein
LRRLVSWVAGGLREASYSNAGAETVQPFATAEIDHRAGEMNVSKSLGAITAEVTCPSRAKLLIRQSQLPQKSKSESLVTCQGFIPISEACK